MAALASSQNPHKKYWLQALLEAPAGSVTLFTTDVIDIFDAAIIPTDEFDTLNVTMPMNPILSPDLKTPLWSVLFSSCLRSITSILVTCA